MTIRHGIVSLIILGLFILSLLFADEFFEWRLAGSDVFPGDLVIAEVSSAGEDWVKLRNKTDYEIDLSSFTFTDGDNSFSFPESASIEPNGEISLASSNDKDKISWNADFYWGDWGISASGETVMLIDTANDRVVDFLYVPKTGKNETLKREVGMARESYLSMSREIITNIGRDLKALVVFLGALLGAIVTLLTNLETITRFFQKRVRNED